MTECWVSIWDHCSRITQNHVLRKAYTSISYTEYTGTVTEIVKGIYSTKPEKAT